MKTPLTTRVEGSFVTDLALNRFYNDGDLSGAIELLRGCLINPEIPPEQIFTLILRILNKEARIEGTYPDEDYGVVISDEMQTDDPLENISDHIKALHNKAVRQENRIEELECKMGFIETSLSHSERRRLSEEYKSEWDEQLFDDDLADMELLSSECKSTIDRMNNNSDEKDYGWLEPDGTFYSVPWGEHENFASKWLEKKYPDEKKRIAVYHNSGRTCASDILIYVFNLILLHNPAQGLTKITRNQSAHMTKLQREFMTKYYNERNMTKQLEELDEIP